MDPALVGTFAREAVALPHQAQGQEDSTVRRTISAQLESSSLKRALLKHSELMKEANKKATALSVYLDTFAPRA